MLCSDGGVMVSIVAFQAVDPGSIPGHRTLFLLKLCAFFKNIAVVLSSNFNSTFFFKIHLILRRCGNSLWLYLLWTLFDARIVKVDRHIGSSSVAYSGGISALVHHQL